MVDVQLTTYQLATLDDDRHTHKYREKRSRTEPRLWITMSWQWYGKYSRANVMTRIDHVRHSLQWNETPTTMDETRTGLDQRVFQSDWDMMFQMLYDDIVLEPIDDANDHNHRNNAELFHTMNNCIVFLEQPNTTYNP